MQRVAVQEEGCLKQPCCCKDKIVPRDDHASIFAARKELLVLLQSENSADREQARDRTFAKGHATHYTEVKAIALVMRGLMPAGDQPDPATKVLLAILP